MSNENAQPAVINEERIELSEADRKLIVQVALGLTDGEIATESQIPKHITLDGIARLLAKLGARERIEILLYAFSEPTMYQRIIAEIAKRNTKTAGAEFLGEAESQLTQAIFSPATS